MRITNPALSPHPPFLPRAEPLLDAPLPDDVGKAVTCLLSGWHGLQPEPHILILLRHLHRMARPWLWYAAAREINDKEGAVTCDIKIRIKDSWSGLLAIALDEAIEGCAKDAQESENTTVLDELLDELRHCREHFQRADPALFSLAFRRAWLLAYKSAACRAGP